MVWLFILKKWMKIDINCQVFFEFWILLMNGNTLFFVVSDWFLLVLHLNGFSCTLPSMLFCFVLCTVRYSFLLNAFIFIFLKILNWSIACSAGVLSLLYFSSISRWSQKNALQDTQSNRWQLQYLIGYQQFCAVPSGF